MSLPDKFAIAHYHAANNWAHAYTLWVSIPDRCYFYTRGCYSAGGLDDPGNLALRFDAGPITTVMRNHLNGSGYSSENDKPVTSGRLPMSHGFSMTDNTECLFPKKTPVRFTGGLFRDPVTHDISRNGWRDVELPKMFERLVWVRFKLTNDHLLWLESAYPKMSLSCIKVQMWAEKIHRCGIGKRASLTKRRLNWMLAATKSNIKKTNQSLRRAFNWWEKPTKTPQNLLRQFVARRMRKYRDVSESTLRLFRLMGAASKLANP